MRLCENCGGKVEAKTWQIDCRVLCRICIDCMIENEKYVLLKIAAGRTAPKNNEENLCQTNSTITAAL
jgi:hypothetical protein